MEYRMIDYNMFDETMTEEINGLTKRGWVIIRILDPMKWVNSDGMFIRIFFEREVNEGTSESKLNIACTNRRELLIAFEKWRNESDINEMWTYSHMVDNFIKSNL